MDSLPVGHDDKGAQFKLRFVGDGIHVVSKADILGLKDSNTPYAKVKLDPSVLPRN